MNAAAAAAIAQVKAILAPRELTTEQRLACHAARAHLNALAAMVRDFNDAAEPLRGYMAPINLAAVRLRLQSIDQLLADDRKARAA